MKSKSTLRSYLLLAGSSLFAVSSLPAATFYWDADATTSTAGFGTAGGTWAQNNTTGARWTTSNAGTLAGSATQVTASDDIFNFGTATVGLGGGTITVSGIVTMGDTIYGAASGAIVLTGGTINFGAAKTITVNNASNTIGSVIGGAATSLTKAGAGKLVLTGNNTYSGTTIVSGNGTLAITGAHSGTGAITINGGMFDLGDGTATGSLASTALTVGAGTFSYTRTGTNTQSFTTSSISSTAAALSVNAGNTLELGTVSRAQGVRFDFSSVGAGIVAADTASNNNGIMSSFTLGDTWVVANGPGVAISGLPNGSYTLSSLAGTTAANYLNGNIDVNSSPVALDASITANSLRFSSAAANTLTLTDATNTLTNGGILVASTVGNNLSTITGGTLAGAASKDLSIIQNNSAGGLTISSIIGNNTGATSLVKSGAGLLTLSNSNTFTGGVFLHGGQLTLANAGALNSTTPNNVTFSSGSAGRLTLNGNSLTVPVVSGSNAGTAIIENANASNATLTINSTSNSNFAGVIQNGTGAGTLALTKDGSGTLTLSGANSYSGGTTLAAGTVNASNATSFGAGSVSVTGSSKVQVAGGLTYANPVDVGAALTLQVPTATPGTATYSGQLTGSSNITVEATLTNGVTGTHAFTNTNNTFTGSILMPIGSTGTGSGNDFVSFNSIGDGGTFTFRKRGHTNGIIYTGASPIAFNTRQIAFSSTDFGGIFDGGGSNPVNRFLNDATDPANTVTFNTNITPTTINSAGIFFFAGSNTGNNTFSGIISNPSNFNLGIGKAGAGKWILTGANTYLGNVKVSGGTLSVPVIATAATAQPLGQGTIIELGHQNTGGTLEFTGGTASTTDKQVQMGNANSNNGNAGGATVLNNGTGSLTFSNGTFNPTVATVTATRTLTLRGTNTGDNTISGVIQDNVASTGKVALTKSDSGIWVLGGVNTYSGNTTLSNTGGTLKLDYSTLPQNNSKLSDTGTLTLGTGTTLELIGGTHTEIVASTTISSSSALPASVSQTGGSSVLQMGAITRNTGAYISFSGSGIATTSTLNNSFGILGTWATVNNGNDWAVNSTNAVNGPITAPVYTDVARLGGSQVIADASASQVRIIEGAGSAADITLGAATTTIATLTQSTTGGASVSVIDPAGQTLAVGAILAQNGAGSLTIGNGTNNGNIQALSAGGDLVVNTVGASNVTINSVIQDNTSSSTLTKIGTGTLTLSGTNTYAGGTTIINNGGTLRITNAAALGAGAVTISTAGTNTGTLELALTGTNSITNTFNGFSSANNLGIGNAQILNTSGDNTITSNLTITGTGGNGLNVASNGGLLTLAGTITHTIASARTLSLGGSGDGVVSGAINNNAAVNLSVIKSGSGTWTLFNTASTYAGVTNITGGTLAMGASDVLPDTSAVSIGAGTLDAATYTDTAGTLDVTAAATLNLGAAAALAFANSSAVSWTGGTLNITGTFVSGSSIRFGTTSGGLTPTQLGLITVNGSGPVSIDGSGYLTTGAVSGFAAWQDANSTGGGRDQDHDGDGVDNGTEHFLGGTAITTGFTALPGVVNTAGILSVTWTKAGTYSGTYGTDFTVETSATLSGPWTPETVGGNVTITGNDVKYTFPGGPSYSGKNFARLKVTGP